jgi:hypothetical protein
MPFSLKFPAAFMAIAFLTTACASETDVRALRQPSMPPVAVARANPLGRFFHNVAIQDVDGTPEFRWFDGGAVLTTRPTRVQVLRSLTDKLDRADLLGANRLDSQYMLYVHFEDLRGPDVWFGSDKLASAKITFRLVDWRTRTLVKTEVVDASYRVRWAGITPDMARAAIAGPIGITRDSAFAPVGGLIGGAVVGYYVNENLVAKIVDAPLVALAGAEQAREIGGVDREPSGFWAALAPALAAGTARGHFSDFEAMMAGGLIFAAGASQGPVTAVRPTAANAEIGSFNGTDRRFAANRGLLDLAFDEFMQGLSKDGDVRFKRAVSCAALNPYGYRTSYVSETADAYAIDCPGSKFNESKTTSALPSRF